MEQYEKVLLTVIIEAALEAQIEKIVRKAGASGYTISDVRGMGHHGVRAGEFEQTGNIKIEILCNASTAEELAETIRQRFFADYAVILFTSRVSVLRSERFF
jgi:nitrogen regulatory protein PII